MNQIISILQLKFKSIYNKAFRSTGQRKFKSLAIMLFVGIYLVQLHLAIKSFFNIFESFSSLGPLGAANLLSIVFTGLFLFMLFTSFFSGIPMMFKASDTNFLIVHNIGEREIFSTKYILAIFQVIWIPLIAATPLITAYGAYFSATPIFYPLSILSMALMLLIAASLGIIISLILARIFKPILLKHLLFTIGVCLAILMVLAFKKINPSALASPGAPNRIAMNFIERISSSTFSLRPDFWTADGIINLGYRRNLDFISRFSLMLSSFILIFILAMTFVSKYIFAPIMLK